MAQVSRSSLYRARRTEPVFEAEWADAFDISVEAAEGRLEAIVFDDGAGDGDVIRAVEILLRGRSERYRR